MPFDIRTLSNVERTEANLKELMVAYHARGPPYCHDLALTNDVIRKAKGLQTSLGKLGAAVDDHKYQPLEEPPMTQDPLNLRLFFQAHMTELARHISYGGKRETDVEAKLAEMRARFGEEKVRGAVRELTAKDEKSGLIVLRPDVRHLCRGLLGPAPGHDDYARYYEINRREPPPEHQPPGPDEDAKPAKKRGRSR